MSENNDTEYLLKVIKGLYKSDSIDLNNEIFTIKDIYAYYKNLNIIESETFPTNINKTLTYEEFVDKCLYLIDTANITMKMMFEEGFIRQLTPDSASIIFNNAGMIVILSFFDFHYSVLDRILKKQLSDKENKNG